MREMKYSGVEWIGEIPERWEINRLKNKISTHFGGCWGEDAKGNEFDVLCIRIADFDFPSQSVKPTASTFRNYTQSQIEKGLLKDGDLIIEKSGGGDKTPVGRVIVYNSKLFPKAMFANFSECIRPKEIKVTFLAYQLKSLYYSVDMHYFFNQTTGLQNLDMQTYLNALLCIPPLPEQQAIADILDRKCTQIDALIANEEQQIAKLKAYKQSVITETVTKGLNPDVPMKDSGNDYICQIPIHWKAIKIKYLCTMQAGKNLISEQIAESGTYPVYGGNGIRGFFSEPNYKGECLLVGRQGALCGNVHYVSGEFWATEHAVITEPKKEVSIKYLFYLLTGVNLNLYVSPTAAQPGLSVNTVQNVIVCLAPIDEQQQIADYLDQKCEQIDRLIAIKQQKIEKLQQYKKSVIYEYVTGKREVE